MASIKRDILPEDVIDKTFKLKIYMEDDDGEFEEIVLEINKYDMLIRKKGE